MAEDHHHHHPPNKNPQNHLPPPPPNTEIGGSDGGYKGNYPNPREINNPDPATLRDQWKYATRQYGKWYSHAWGTAILAGLSFFALGWVIKGGNPIPSDLPPRPQSPSPSPSPSPSLNNNK